jgi:hypothetical protein
MPHLCMVHKLYANAWKFFTDGAMCGRKLEVKRGSHEQVF